MIKSTPEFISDRVICLNVKDNSFINEHLIKPLVDRFFTAHGELLYSQLDYNSSISVDDFNSIEVSYLYEYVTNLFWKENGFVKIHPRYLITIDKSGLLKCKETGIFYEKILLNKKPVLYFIFVSIDEILATLKLKNTKV